MEENLCEYEAIRNELLRIQESIANETIYMYVSYIALFSVGFAYQWVFLASFIILIVFQAMINKDDWEMKKCSIYLRTFFENQRRDIHWESLHINKYYLTVRSLQDSEIGWKIYNFSSSFLGILSFAALVFVIISKFEHKISSLDVTIIAAGFILLGVVIYVNIMPSYKNGEKEATLKDCIEAYLQEIQSK